MKLFTIITFATLALTAEAKTRGRRGLKSSKSSKSVDVGHECQSCENQLPGYALFGKNYEDHKFYENVREAILNNDPSLILDGDEPAYGEDYFVPGPLGLSTGGNPSNPFTCYDDTGTLFICTLITFLGEAIYRSELLSCLYTQIVTLARNEFFASSICDDVSAFDRERRLSTFTDPQKEAINRVLESEIVDPLQQDIMGSMALIGAESLMGMMDGLGLGCGSTDNPFIDMICNVGEGRKLLPSTDPLPFGSVVTDFLGAIDGIDSDTAMAIQDNLFFVKCSFGTETCAAIFGLLKTFDAMMCRYRDDRGCGSETCTRDLEFDVNFQAERLIMDLPFVEDFPLADLLAPCDYCLANKSGGCAAFCPYYKSITNCPSTYPFLNIAPYAFNGFIQSQV